MKSQGFCSSVHPFPTGCQVNEKGDKTNDITGKDQVPLMLIHGNEDTVVPYVNGKEVFYRAQDVGLPSALVTIPGAKHVPFTEMFLPKYFGPIMLNIIAGLDLVNAEAPEGTLSSC
jgi:fermentation-respiration switch protein FrsA (DUF1100 family)